MDKCTHEIRTQYWKEIIRACQQRTAGQSAKQWMDENGICEQSYYHWQRRFRQETYDQIKEPAGTVPAIRKNNEVAFAEIKCPMPKNAASDILYDDYLAAAVIRTSAMTIAISNEISERLLSEILKGVSNA